MISPLRTPIRTPFVSSASVNSSPEKNFSIKSSSPIATASAIWSLYICTSSIMLSGIGCATESDFLGPWWYQALLRKMLTVPTYFPSSMIGTSNGMTLFPNCS